MVDLSQTDTFDDWFFHPNDTVISDVNQSSSSSLPASPVLSSNESTLPITKISEEENQIKKRKNEQKTDLNEHKKSKQTPSYMRRNIRHLLTNDKLQDDTLSALKVEQDRLKRLEEINDNYQQFNTIYTHLSANNYQQFKQTPSNEQECIVLDDDENEKESLSLLKINSITERKFDNDDGNDSDVQCVDDDDTELVNDKLTKKLQRLHVDDRVNIPDENGMKYIN
jgi:hypothetical protein